ncbi:MAG: hypothetical protein FWG71_10205 [Synergistaceae bacterium]|nr:hypothetical protein [Synergistaceae bacterium]
MAFKPGGIFIRKKKAVIWDFVGKIKATGSVEEERESMIEAAIVHAMGEEEKTSDDFSRVVGADGHRFVDIRQ